MAQIFNPGANNFARLSLLASGLFLVIIVGIIFTLDRSPYSRAPIGIAINQPVRFSHELHTGTLNLECLYCHETVDNSSYGGIPDTHTCMTCHSQIATYSELLEPVRTSYETGTPLVWNKVHDLAEHVYFNHSAHVTNGFACETCHGDVTEMPLVWQDVSMTMGWCLECHRNPEQYIRPLDDVYTFNYEPAGDQVEIGLQLVEERGIDTARLDSCSICHR